MDNKELKVNAIKNGTVIDHIPAKDLFKVISILNLEKMEQPITFGTNLDSKQLGKKAIIKISNKYFDDQEINKIALITPQANLNIIKDYEVVEKRKVELPNQINKICKCMNPKCITNAEPMETKFDVISKSPIKLKCKYCEKITFENYIKINQ